MKIALLLAALLAVPLVAVPAYAQANAQVVTTDKGTLDIDFALEPNAVSAGEPARMKIDFVNPSTERIQVHIDYEITVSADGGGAPVKTIPLTHTSSGSVSIPIEFEFDGPHTVEMGVKGILFQPIPLETANIGLTIGGGSDASEEADTTAGGYVEGKTRQAMEEVEGTPGEGGGADVTIPDEGQGGGCLIATAAYGTEMAGQVQLLREIRDGAVMGTQAGASFVESFNTIYYAFSPAVADLERQNPALREAVKMGVAPMLATLTLLGAAEIDSDGEMVSYGLAVLLISTAMYAGVPMASALAARGLAARAWRALAPSRQTP